MKKGKIILSVVAILATIGSAFAVSSHGNRFNQGTLFTKTDGVNCNPVNCKRQISGYQLPNSCLLYYRCQNAISGTPKVVAQ